MRYTRVSASPDGESRAEDIELEDARNEDGVAILMDSATTRVTTVSFAPDYHQDWHCSPVPTMCVVVTGEAVFTMSHGETRRVGPGAVVLTDDTTGKGHRTGAGGNGAVLLVVRLAT
ncbi:MAG: hypothetical protein ACR2JC_19235 [Chloroflexota bacterium]|nr:MAG: hypothetical protein DLM70_06370 [Chloroflexota bacterium]